MKRWLYARTGKDVSFSMADPDRANVILLPGRRAQGYAAFQKLCRGVTVLGMPYGGFTLPVVKV
ncbi:MAG: hypothetical protein VB051_05655 [Candidatus Pelethousia sp.]|nr:hypothetical protein [Candidatus Pelethousia sp.]